MRRRSLRGLLNLRSRARPVSDQLPDEREGPEADVGRLDDNEVWTPLVRKRTLRGLAPRREHSADVPEGIDE